MQVQFLLGRQGPAQCLNMTNAPMKIYLVPRNGDKPIVSIWLFCFLCRGQTCIAVLQERCKVKMTWLLLQTYVLFTKYRIASGLQEVSYQAVFCNSSSLSCWTPKAEIESKTWGLSWFDDEVTCTAWSWFWSITVQIHVHQNNTWDVHVTMVQVIDGVEPCSLIHTEGAERIAWELMLAWWWCRWLTMWSPVF